MIYCLMKGIMLIGARPKAGLRKLILMQNEGPKRIVIRMEVYTCLER
jgi:hypothetical protein